MQRTFLTFLTFLMALLSPAAFAHPGEHHGNLLHNLFHLLTEPDHLALILLAIIAGWGGARLFRHRKTVRNQQRHR